jgi:hypothetical protein
MKKVLAILLALAFAAILLPGCPSGGGGGGGSEWISAGVARSVDQQFGGVITGAANEKLNGSHEGDGLSGLATRAVVTQSVQNYVEGLMDIEDAAPDIGARLNGPIVSRLSAIASAGSVNSDPCKQDSDADGIPDLWEDTEVDGLKATLIFTDGDLDVTLDDYYIVANHPGSYANAIEVSVVDGPAGSHPIDVDVSYNKIEVTKAAVNSATVTVAGKINTGTDGICQSTIAGDDDYILPFNAAQTAVPDTAGVTAGPDGLCQTTPAGAGDILTAIVTGTGCPDLPEITTGPDGKCESTVDANDAYIAPYTAVLLYGNISVPIIMSGGDGICNIRCAAVNAADVAVACDGVWTIISAGPDGVCDTVANNAGAADDGQEEDVNEGCDTNAVCILDGNRDGELEINTVANGDDELLPAGCKNGSNCAAVIAGGNGVCDSKADDGDLQLIPLGNGGDPHCACVNVGADGIANTTPAHDDTLVSIGADVGAVSIPCVMSGIDAIADTAAPTGDVDEQRIAVGNGEPNVACISTGADGKADSVDTKLGDDVLIILTLGNGGDPDCACVSTSANGISETTANALDAQAIPLNQGLPDQDCIDGDITGTGLVDSTVNALDVAVAPVYDVTRSTAAEVVAEIKKIDVGAGTIVDAGLFGTGADEALTGDGNLVGGLDSGGICRGLTPYNVLTQKGDTTIQCSNGGSTFSVKFNDCIAEQDIQMQMFGAIVGTSVGLVATDGDPCVDPADPNCYICTNWTFTGAVAAPDAIGTVNTACAQHSVTIYDTDVTDGMTVAVDCQYDVPWTFVYGTDKTPVVDIVLDGQITRHYAMDSKDEQLLHIQYDRFTQVWVTGTYVPGYLDDALDGNPFIQLSGQQMEYRVVDGEGLPSDGTVPGWTLDGMGIDKTRIVKDLDGRLGLGYPTLDYARNIGEDNEDGAFIFSGGDGIVALKGNDGQEGIQLLGATVLGGGSVASERKLLVAFSYYDRNNLMGNATTPYEKLLYGDKIGARCGDPYNGTAVEPTACVVKVNINLLNGTYDVVAVDTVNCPDMAGFTLGGAGWTNIEWAK